MAIEFRYNNANYSLNEQTSAIAENNLVYYSGGAKNYCPALPTRGTKVLVKTDNNGKTYIDNSSPSICFKKNGTVYYCAKSSIFSSKSTIKYDANGGSGFMSSQEYYPNDGETVTIKECQFTRNGYSFVNWNTYPNGRGTAYYAGSTPKGVFGTLYAQWTLLKTTIPAGTYSPKTFAGLIEKYISINGKRDVKYQCTMIVNNQTYSISPNSTVQYRYRYSNSSTPCSREVQFSSGDLPSYFDVVNSASGWTKYGTLLIRREPDGQWYEAAITLKNPLVFK